MSNVSVPVTGRVQVHSHGAILHLAPVVQHPQHPRPELREVDTWEVHPSRLPVTKESLASAMVVVQKQLCLTAGVHGGGTPGATLRLRENLEKPKKGVKRQEDEERSDLKALDNGKEPLLSIEDQSFSPNKHMRRSAGSSPRAKPAPETLDDKQQKISKAEMGEKQAKVEETTEQASAEAPSDSDSETSSTSTSSSSSSSSTPKANLRRYVNELEDAIGCHQEIEDENERLMAQNAYLKKVNRSLCAKVREIRGL